MIVLWDGGLPLPHESLDRAVHWIPLIDSTGRWLPDLLSIAFQLGTFQSGLSSEYLVIILGLLNIKSSAESSHVIGGAESVMDAWDAEHRHTCGEWVVYLSCCSERV